MRRLNIGWVIVWQRSPDILAYLAKTGFRFDYAADGAWVYREFRPHHPAQDPRPRHPAQAASR